MIYIMSCGPHTDTTWPIHTYEMSYSHVWYDSSRSVTKCCILPQVFNTRHVCIYVCNMRTNFRDLSILQQPMNIHQQFSCMEYSIFSWSKQSLMQCHIFTRVFYTHDIQPVVYTIVIHWQTAAFRHEFPCDMTHPQFWYVFVHRWRIAGLYVYNICMYT